MKRTMQTLMLTVGAVALSSGAVMAAGDTAIQTNTAPAMETQAGVNAEPVTSTSEQVESVQSTLAQEGYNITVDGVWGPRTADAVRQFQQANNLDVTGQIDAQTLSALNLDASASRGTAMGETRR